ncbi:hypothetical protein [Nocardia asiatica]|uniref:hypothetical protein n=1 Tax=Nocardia asiatica TaxID=209252 RepID=UPI002455AC1F|nr:hypothetical protein [Nocardia asiatica]
MVKHSAAYEAYVLELLAQPPDSFDHLTAVAVATCATDDALEKLLFSMYLEDPKGTHEFEVAAHLLSLHFGSAVAS